MIRRRKVTFSKPNDQTAGSPPSGEPVFLVVGRFRRSHGLKGEIQLEPITDFPERLRVNKLVYVGEDKRPLKIASRRWQDTLLLVSFDGYHDIDQVSELRNQLLYVRADDLPELPEGEYYHHQLLGSRVLDEEGRELGTLVDILETGANDVYMVRTPEGGEMLFPAIPNVVLSVDIQGKEIRVRPMDWY